MTNERRQVLVENSEATGTPEQRLESICLLQALGTDSGEVDALVNRIEQHAYNKEYVEFAKLTIGSPFLENNSDEETNCAEAISDIAKRNIETIIPDIDVVYKNMRTINKVILAGIFGVVVSLVFIFWGGAKDSTTHFVVSLALFLSFLLTVVSALSLCHLSSVARKYHELIMMCSVEHTAAITNKYEKQGALINSLLSNPQTVLHSVSVSHGAACVGDLHKSLKQHFSK